APEPATQAKGKPGAASRKKTKAARLADGVNPDAEDAQSVMNFSLAEVRDVRLVPVVDFGSGRK
ncbi:MAG: hypothetical protein ACP5NM_11730, partial [Thiomonas sp.]